MSAARAGGTRFLAGVGMSIVTLSALCFVWVTGLASPQDRPLLVIAAVAVILIVEPALRAPRDAHSSRSDPQRQGRR